MTLAAENISIDQLLNALRDRGVSFAREGEGLKVLAPKGAITAEDAAIIRARKKEILVAIEAGTSSAPANDVAMAAPRSAKQKLGYLQERIWSHQQMFPDLPLYNLAMAWRLKGALDKPALERALSGVVARHEVLRSHFKTDDGTPYVTFAPPSPIALETETIADESQLMGRLEALRDSALDLHGGETFRTRLFEFDDNHHVLVFMPHHIVWDGMSWDVFLRDLSALYEADINKTGAQLPALTMQYADYAAWHWAWMESPALDRETQDWGDYYSTDTPALALPSDVKRPKLFSYEGDAITFKIAPATFSAVNALAACNQCTNFMIYLAIWQAFLARITGNNDIVVGAPVQGRNDEGLVDLVGCFGNVLGLRQNVDSSMSFSQFLKQSRNGFLDVLERQNAPMEHLATVLRGSLDISRTSLFQAMFTHQNEAGRTAMLGDVEIEMINIAPAGAPTDIRLEIIDSANDALGELNYAKAVTTHEGAEYLMRCFKVFLEEAVMHPDRPLSDLAIMDEADRRCIVTEWNATKTPYARNALAFDYFDQLAHERPDAPAVSMDNVTVTYGELLARSNRIGNCLQSKGIGEGDIVAVYLDRSIDMIAAIFAIWKTGAAMLPIDPEFPVNRLTYMIEDSQTKLVITTTNLVEDWLIQAAPILDLHGQAEVIEASPASAPMITRRDSEGRCYVIYTSGSTGNPKGVENSHRALCNFLEAMIHEPGMRRDEKLLAVTTVSFDVMLLELFVPLSVGAEVILASDDDAMDGFALADIIENRGVTMLQGTPATWRILFDADWKGAPSMTALCGGEAMPASIADKLPGMVGKLWNMYGPTETTVWSTCASIESGDNIHVGTPIANTQIYILDPNGNPTPAGVAGDLWIGGDGVALGYLGKPELTAERFKDNPFDPSLGRIYNTGDRACWRRDGVIQILGRDDEQVKIRGYRIELGDIEAALAKHPGIRHSAAAVRNDQSGEPALVAYVVFKDGEKATNSELRRYMRDHVPNYMVPQFFMPLSEMPLTSNNKVDRKALPDPAGASAVARRVAPRNDTEKSLAAIWAEILNFEDISVTDNFFELGGQSLQVARMIVRARDSLGLKIMPRAVIFETLEQLAAGSLAQR